VKSDEKLYIRDCDTSFNKEKTPLKKSICSVFGEGTVFHNNLKNLDFNGLLR